MYITMCSAACERQRVGATEYLATARTALRMYGMLWLANLVKCLTNDRNSSSRSASVAQSCQSGAKVIHRRSTLSASGIERR